MSKAVNRHLDDGLPTPVVEQRGPRSDVIKLFAALVTGKLVVFFTALCAYGAANFLYDMSTRWDSAWFLAIANSGYTAPNVLVSSPYEHTILFPNDFAFPPFFPALIKGLTFLTGTGWVSALLLVNALSFVFPYLVYRTFGFRVALLAELFPLFLVYTTIPYSESLTLLFLALAILLAVRSRVLTSSGSLTFAILSAYGLALTLPSFSLAFIRKYRLRTLLFFVLPLLGGVLILAWYQFVSGSYWTYFTVESTHWHVSSGYPWDQATWLLETAKHSLGYWPFPGGWMTRNLPFEAFYIFGAVYLLRAKTENRVFLAAYSLSVVLPLLFVVGGPALSVPRLMLPAFPVFVGYAFFIRGRYLWLYAGVCLSLTVWVALSQLTFFFA